jgi:hypothetical protein
LRGSKNIKNEPSICVVSTTSAPTIDILQDTNQWLSRAAVAVLHEGEEERWSQGVWVWLRMY